MLSDYKYNIGLLINCYDCEGIIKIVKEQVFSKNPAPLNIL
ncbi:hypothetical protein KL86DYS1_11677 [uncultured Dysgonomonas sp.]|uniref:Uncharacterized protein n=1 Tax=uncultured Dysgonomonas sp. TaxID=206096 RepID=A0A212JAV0_9BACT|nr:hypothetical protein KL86DYS1_11677 [uncultured Dysgonomonas sp.]